MPEHGARVRFLMGTNVNTPFLQVRTLKFGHGAIPGSWALCGLNKDTNSSTNKLTQQEFLRLANIDIEIE